MSNAAVLVLAIAAIASAQPDRFGLPSCSNDHAELAGREFFLLCHDSQLRVPLWTVYEMRPGRSGGSLPRPRYFRQDVAFTAFARNADYRNSGFSRGHMVPAEDMSWSAASLRATFVLSNVVPQRRVNSGKWRQLEAAIRTLAAESDSVCVFTGPIFASGPSEFIGEARVAVPTHTFKAVLAIRGEQRRMFAAIVPNEDVLNGQIEDYLVSVDEVERATGLDFFSGLDDEEETRLESRKPSEIAW